MTPEQIAQAIDERATEQDRRDAEGTRQAQEVDILASGHRFEAGDEAVYVGQWGLFYEGTAVFVRYEGPWLACFGWGGEDTATMARIKFACGAVKRVELSALMTPAAWAEGIRSNQEEPEPPAEPFDPTDPRTFW